MTQTTWMEELKPPLSLPELLNPIQMIELYKNQRAVLFILGPQIDIIRKNFFFFVRENKLSNHVSITEGNTGFSKKIKKILFYCHQTGTTGKFRKEIHFNPLPGFVSSFSNGTHTAFELNMRNAIWEISSNH